MKEKIEQILTDILVVGMEFPDGVPDAEELPFTMIMHKGAAAAALAKMVQRKQAELQKRVTYLMECCKAKDSELRELRTKHEQLERESAADVARMAEMGDIIEEAQNVIFAYLCEDDPEFQPDDGLLQSEGYRLRQALELAPRMLWAGKGRWRTDLMPGRSDLVLLGTYQEADGREVGIATTNYLGHGKPVRVFAVADD